MRPSGVSLDIGDRPCRALVVDDRASGAQSVQEMLAREGILTSHALSGADALN